ncbi:GntR family transcriptional regulator [Agromyces sp. H3Y2-19a]|jgi:DNA-binding GntR family transcriptional regulator|uniref:GntR family transcriptional regulator n=1 Tax=Agromyces TaxID=33877 RepID=UPI001E3E300C|nr:MULTISPECIES: GntR family transcriptional regulator [Agromyces]MCD5345225.1 GntR family transcriptional regulator [Agromyces sp. S2-1-8]MDF0513616.1 GntR family transcriptional regulator [Agromyces chromiiresistens]
MRASERAYRALREEILDGVLAPGTALAEVEQANRLGVSRTPVREALARLEADGLATAASARVLQVSALDAASIVSLYEVREALEGQASRLAARRRDPARFAELRRRLAEAPELLDEGDDGLRAYYDVVDALDDEIEAAVANPMLAAALQSARLHSARVRRLARQHPERLRAAASEHLLIVDAIIAGDTDLAAHATHVHLHLSLRHALASIEERSALVSPTGTA